MSTERPKLIIALDDRRESERFSSESTAVWRVVSESWDEATQVTVRDISTTGVGLVVKQPLKPGSVLIINLQNRNQQLVRPLSIRVMHSTPVDDKTFIVG